MNWIAAQMGVKRTPIKPSVYERWLAVKITQLQAGKFDGTPGVFSYVVFERNDYAFI